MGVWAVLCETFTEKLSLLWLFRRATQLMSRLWNKRLKNLSSQWQLFWFLLTGCPSCGRPGFSSKRSSPPLYLRFLRALWTDPLGQQLFAHDRNRITPWDLGNSCAAVILLESGKPYTSKMRQTLNCQKKMDGTKRLKTGSLSLLVSGFYPSILFSA